MKFSNVFGWEFDEKKQRLIYMSWISNKKDIGQIIYYIHNYICVCVCVCVCIISSDQSSCSVVSDSVTSWTAGCQDSLSITNSQNLLKLMSIESMMPSNHFILCCPLLLPPTVFLSIKVFSDESVLHIR